MPDPSAPFLFARSFVATNFPNPTFNKILVSSLSRSLFSGSIYIFRNHEMPLFKVERRQIEEVFALAAPREEPEASGRNESMAFLFGLRTRMEPEPRQWVIIPDTASVALRNIDHLIPADSKSVCALAEVDFYWTKVMNRSWGKGEISASQGLWAVRGEFLPMVMERWQRARSEILEGGTLDEAAVWSQVVRDLPLQKKPFEKSTGSVDRVSPK